MAGREEFSVKLAFTVIGVFTSTLTQIAFHYAMHVMGVNYIYRVGLHALNILMALAVSRLIPAWSLGYIISWTIGGSVAATVGLMDQIEVALYMIVAIILVYRMLRGG
jgi:hypothetical protein